MIHTWAPWVWGTTIKPIYKYTSFTFSFTFTFTVVCYCYWPSDYNSAPMPPLPVIALLTFQQTCVHATSCIRYQSQCLLRHFSASSYRRRSNGPLSASLRRASGRCATEMTMSTTGTGSRCGCCCCWRQAATAWLLLTTVLSAFNEFGQRLVYRNINSTIKIINPLIKTTQQVSV